jgi:hypothetical protein
MTTRTLRKNTGDLASASSAGLIPNYAVGGEGNLSISVDSGTWATIDSAKYKWIQTGSLVTLFFRLESATACSGTTGIYFGLPSGAPAASFFSTATNGEFAYAGTCIGSTGVAVYSAAIFNNTGVARIYIRNITSGESKLQGTIQYFV